MHIIDIKVEKIQSLAEASRWIPSSRRGKKVHVRTIVRWHRVGISGVKLAAFWAGGTLMTSLEAIESFFAEVSLAKEQKSRQLQTPPALPPPPPPRAKEQKSRQLQTMPAVDVVTEPEVVARLKAKKLIPKELKDGGHPP